MMLMPSIFGDKLFDDFMDFPFGSYGTMKKQHDENRY